MTSMSLLLFDLDGCLVDSTRPITSGINHALVEVGLPARDPHDLTRCIGPPLFTSFETLLREAGADEGLAGRCVDLYRDVYPAESLRSTTVVPGIPEALDRLAPRAVLAVVTSKPAVYAVPIITSVGLRDRFAAIHAPGTDLQGEPKAVTLRRALDHLGAHLAPDGDPARAVMIGDREHDVLAGVACGTRTVGVTWGSGDRAELQNAGADHLVSTPAELLGLLA